MSEEKTASEGSQEPIGERPACGPACRCGSPWHDEMDAGGVWRCEAGHPRPNTPGPAMKHGGRSKLVGRGLLPEQAEVLALIAEREAAILKDRGGAENVGQLTRDLVRRYLEAGLIADYLSNNIVRHGVLTTKGRTRAAVNTYLHVLDRLHRIAGAIGLERAARQVPSPLDYIDGKVGS